MFHRKYVGIYRKCSLKKPVVRHLQNIFTPANLLEIGPPNIQNIVSIHIFSAKFQHLHFPNAFWEVQACKCSNVFNVEPAQQNEKHWTHEMFGTAFLQNQLNIKEKNLRCELEMFGTALRQNQFDIKNSNTHFCLVEFCFFLRISLQKWQTFSAKRFTKNNSLFSRLLALLSGSAWLCYAFTCWNCFFIFTHMMKQ